MVGFYDHELSGCCTVAAFDLASVSCNQLVVGPIHACGGTLDLMTDVPDLVRVAVAAPIGNSDHSSLPAVISMAQAVPNLCLGRKVFGNTKLINWNTVCGAVQDLPWHSIFGLLTILFMF